MMKSKDNLSLNLFNEEDSAESEKDKEKKYYNRVKEILDKVIIDLAGEDPAGKISIIAIFSRYNEELNDPKFKINAHDPKALEIISEKLKEIERFDSAKNIDSHIKDMKRIEDDKSKPGTLKEMPINDFPTFAERSLPKEDL